MPLIGFQASDDLHERWRHALENSHQKGAPKLRELVELYVKTVEDYEREHAPKPEATGTLIFENKVNGEVVP